MGEDSKMIDLLNIKLMEDLNAVQSNLTDVSEDYQISKDYDFSCVRCSGSAGRYVYEKQDNTKITTSKNRV